jgi:hypothetical protein
VYATTAPEVNFANSNASRLLKALGLGGEDFSGEVAAATLIEHIEDHMYRAGGLDPELDDRAIRLREVAAFAAHNQTNIVWG